MASWQRPARLALGIFAVAFAVALAVLMRERTPAAPWRSVARLDPKAIAEIRGGDVIQVKGATRDIRVEFGSQVTYEDGRTKLADFKASIDNRAGRSFVVSGQEAWIGTERTSYDLRGNVVMQTSDGLTARTEHATYAEAEGILRADGPVAFQRGRMSGSGVGFTYDKQLDRLWLMDQAVIQFAPDGNAPGMQVNAGSAGHSRAERYLRFERGVRMAREGQVVEAEQSTVFLLAERDEPDRIELRGNARITGAAGTGSLQAMSARDINLDYTEDGRTLETALLAGQAAIQMARGDRSPGQQLSAELIDLSLAPDGAVTRLAGRDRVRIVLPATAGASARTVTAASLGGVGQAGRGLSEMTFEGGVEYREAATRGSTERVARARTLEAVMAESGTIDDAEFAGGFTFDDGPLKAASADARYQIAKGALALTSPQGAPPPHVADENVTIDAESIEVTLMPRQMTAEGNVRMVLSASRRPVERRAEGGSHPGDTEPEPTILKESEAVFVTAEKLAFEEQAGRGSFSGQARLWQGETSIQAEAITLDDRAGDLTATGNVRTVLPIAGRKTAGGKQTSIAKAGEFRFEPAKRRVIYAKQAQFDGVQGNLHAERIELILGTSENAVERLDAQGTVRVVIDKREATGTALTYLPSEQRYTLTGSPVRLVEACRETSGRTLTFYGASDRISVDGNEEQRTQTKGGSKCPEPPIG